MGFIYSSLNKSDSESWSQFDNRIARMLPFVTGEVYFDLRNYNACTGEFGVYTRWDDELKDVLGYELPCGGYFVKATITQAYKFHNLGCSIPVYMKLISHSGRLYPYRTYIMLDGRPYSLEFGGEELLPMDDRFEELAFDGDVNHQEAGVTSSASGSQMRRLFGSQRFRWNSSQMRQLFGSQRSYALGDIEQMAWPVEEQTIESQDRQDRMKELLMEYPQEWQLINRNRRPVKNIGGNARFGYGLDLI